MSADRDQKPNSDLRFTVPTAPAKPEVEIFQELQERANLEVVDRAILAEQKVAEAIEILSQLRMEYHRGRECTVAIEQLEVISRWMVNRIIFGPMYDEASGPDNQNQEIG